MNNEYITYLSKISEKFIKEGIITHDDYILQTNESQDIIKETYTPTDKETILGSFEKDVSDVKMTPTETFLGVVYEIMNERFFENKLPDNISFYIKSEPRKLYMGRSQCYINFVLETVRIDGIILNSSKTLTLHEWLEIILHEMVHIYDFKFNPEHYTRLKRVYDAHGKWFLDFGEQFKQYGFNVQKYCNAEIGINTDDNRVKRILNNSVFVIFDGMETSKTDSKAIVRINKKSLESFKRIIELGNRRKRYGNLNKLIIMKSENPAIINIQELRMRNEHSGLRYYFYNDNFEQKYGPFEVIEEYDMKNEKIEEDRDEVDYEEMNHIDDEYARKIYDNIKGVVDVEKVKDNEYKVSIY